MDWQNRLKEGYALLDVKLFQIGGTEVSAATLLIFVFIVLATLWISRFVQRAMRRVLSARAVADEGSIAVVQRLVHYLVLIVGLGVALHTVGVNLTALFAAGALFAVGIGFAMQNLTENFVSGVILLLERTIKPGDVLQMEDRMIKVKELGIRSTVARTLDDEDLIIPNSQLVQSMVKNYTLRDQLYRLRAEVGVVYGSDMRLVRKTLEETAAALAWPSRQRKPRVLLTAFADSSVNFEASVWIEDPWRARQRMSDLHEAIWWSLKDAGVVIAFPQLDVHFDPPVTESIADLKLAAG